MVARGADTAVSVVMFMEKYLDVAVECAQVKTA